MTGKMKISIEKDNWKKGNYDLLVFPLFSDSLEPDVRAFLEEISRGILKALIEKETFKGEKEESKLLFLPENDCTSRIVLMGLGKRDEFTGERWRRVCGLAGKEAVKSKCDKTGILLPENAGLSQNSLIEDAVIGFRLGSWQLHDYKTMETDKLFVPEELRVISDDVEEGENSLERGKTISEAVLSARNMAFHPGNVATPTFLEKQARLISEETGISVKVFERDEIVQLGMGGLAAVSRGSEEPAKFILLEYRYSDDAPWIGLVGKGLTFDSGGISLKPGKSMDEMKYDMCGGAAVLGTMKIVGKLKPAVNVVAAVPATENLPGGKSYKPGDIIKAYNGKTVEIKNTDAEGRLILMDGLSYLNEKYKLSAIIDIATLTGAIIVTLGHESTGIFGNDKKLIEKMQEASKISGERLWELPLFEEYSHDIKSEIADIKNIGSPGQAGSATAAAFLKEFVGDTPWVHMDIAGTAWRSKDKPYEPVGPTGAGVRTLFSFIENFSEKNRQ